MFLNLKHKTKIKKFVADVRNGGQKNRNEKTTAVLFCIVFHKCKRRYHISHPKEEDFSSLHLVRTWELGRLPSHSLWTFL